MSPLTLPSFFPPPVVHHRSPRSARGVLPARCPLHLLAFLLRGLKSSRRPKSHRRRRTGAVAIAAACSEACAPTERDRHSFTHSLTQRERERQFDGEHAGGQAQRRDPGPSANSEYVWRASSCFGREGGESGWGPAAASRPMKVIIIPEASAPPSARVSHPNGGERGSANGG